jgi:hypothetical protein
VVNVPPAILPHEREPGHARRSQVGIFQAMRAGQPRITAQVEDACRKLIVHAFLWKRAGRSGAAGRGNARTFLAPATATAAAAAAASAAAPTTAALAMAPAVMLLLAA